MEGIHNSAPGGRIVMRDFYFEHGEQTDESCVSDVVILARDLSRELCGQKTLVPLERIGPRKQFVNGCLSEAASFDLTVSLKEAEVNSSENVTLNGVNLCYDLPLTLLSPSLFQPKHLPGEKFGNLH